MVQKLKKSNAGFTLVELIVVIAILGVLAAVLVPQYIQYVEQSRQGVDRATLNEIFHAVEIEAASRESVATGDVLTVTITAATGAVAYGGTFSGDIATVAPAASSAMKSTLGKGLGVLTISYDANGVYWKTAVPSIGDGFVAGSTRT